MAREFSALSEPTTSMELKGKADFTVRQVFLKDFKSETSWPIEAKFHMYSLGVEVCAIDSSQISNLRWPTLIFF